MIDLDSTALVVDLAWGPEDGLIYLLVTGLDRFINRYDPGTGAFIDTFLEEPPLESVYALEFVPPSRSKG